MRWKLGKHVLITKIDSMDPDSLTLTTLFREVHVSGYTRESNVCVLKHITLEATEVVKSGTKTANATSYMMAGTTTTLIENRKDMATKPAHET